MKFLIAFLSLFACVFSSMAHVPYGRGHGHVHGHGHNYGHNGGYAAHVQPAVDVHHAPHLYNVVPRHGHHHAPAYGAPVPAVYGSPVHSVHAPADTGSSYKKQQQANLSSVAAASASIHGEKAGDGSHSSY